MISWLRWFLSEPLSWSTLNIYFSLKPINWTSSLFRALPSAAIAHPSWWDWLDRATLVMVSWLQFIAPNDSCLESKFTFEHSVHGMYHAQAFSCVSQFWMRAGICTIILIAWVEASRSPVIEICTFIYSDGQFTLQELCVFIGDLFWRLLSLFTPLPLL